MPELKDQSAPIDKINIELKPKSRSTFYSDICQSLSGLDGRSSYGRGVTKYGFAFDTVLSMTNVSNAAIYAIFRLKYLERMLFFIEEKNKKSLIEIEEKINRQKVIDDSEAKKKKIEDFEKKKKQILKSQQEAERLWLLMEKSYLSVTQNLALSGQIDSYFATLSAIGSSTGIINIDDIMREALDIAVSIDPDQREETESKLFSFEFLVGYIYDFLSMEKNIRAMIDLIVSPKLHASNSNVFSRDFFVPYHQLVEHVVSETGFSSRLGSDEFYTIFRKFLFGKKDFGETPRLFAGTSSLDLSVAKKDEFSDAMLTYEILIFSAKSPNGVRRIFTVPMQTEIVSYRFSNERFLEETRDDLFSGSMASAISYFDRQFYKIPDDMAEKIISSFDKIKNG